eukprot:GHVU01143582.1.p1 GENE.GHVU01143582.1~~GHVU01143582.1.p1  ORF type:complete len:220 (+),score=29.06 GHVU01143582.1:912-1571(+)
MFWAIFKSRNSGIDHVVLASLGKPLCWHPWEQSKEANTSVKIYRSRIGKSSVKNAVLDVAAGNHLFPHDVAVNRGWLVALLTEKTCVLIVPDDITAVPKVFEAQPNSCGVTKDVDDAVSAATAAKAGSWGLPVVVMLGDVNVLSKIDDAQMRKDLRFLLGHVHVVTPALVWPTYEDEKMAEPPDMRSREQDELKWVNEELARNHRRQEWSLRDAIDKAT